MRASKDWHCYNSNVNRALAKNNTKSTNGQDRVTKIIPNRLSLRLTLTVLSLLVYGLGPPIGVTVSAAIRRRLAHKRFVIHVPFQIKTHHHTHTVYSHVHSGKGGSHSQGGAKQTIYKILGYSAHGHGGSGGHGSHRSHDHGHHHGNDMYDELHSGGCESSHGPTGDMVFNHFSRKNGEYPFVDEYIDDDDDADIDEEDDEEAQTADAWLR